MNAQPRIVSRKLLRRTGTEGPKHDPYSFTQRTVCCNGLRWTLHEGLNVRLTLDGETLTTDEKEAEQTFELATGIPVDKFDRYYDRLHPYYPDPMGPLSRYE